MLITIEGKLVYVGTPNKIPNRAGDRKIQKVVFEQRYEDKRMKTDYYAVFLYGDDIREFWENYDDQHKPFKAKVTAKLTGRFDTTSGRDSLILRYKQIRWIYQ